jgi:hypothetical protein
MPQVSINATKMCTFAIVQRYSPLMHALFVRLHTSALRSPSEAVQASHMLQLLIPSYVYTLTDICEYCPLLMLRFRGLVLVGVL